MFDILRYSYNSIFGGVLIAVICMALFFFIIKGWYKNATFSPISYVIGTILFMFLSVQCILIVGSLKILDTTDYYETEIANLVKSSYDTTEEVSMENSDLIIKEVIDRFPLLKYYISGGKFSGFTAKELPHAIVNKLRSFMHWYIFRRVLCCLAFVIAGAIGVIKTLSKNNKPSRIGKREQRQRVNIDRRRINRRLRR